MGENLPTISSSKNGSNFRIIQRRTTELAKQNTSKADVLNKLIGNVKTILNIKYQSDKTKEERQERQEASIQAIVNYIKDTIYGEPKLKIDGADEATINSLQDQIQYLCANDGYFACGHQEVTRGTIKMLYNLWDEHCQISTPIPTKKERTYDAFIKWLEDDQYAFPTTNIKLAGSRARGYFNSIHVEDGKNNTPATLMFGNGGYAAARKEISDHTSELARATQNQSFCTPYRPSYLNKSQILNNINSTPIESIMLKPSRLPNIDADTYLFLHGTASTEDKRTTKNKPYIQSKLHEHLSVSNYTTHIIDGVSMLGAGFTHNVFKGLEFLLRSFVDKLETVERQEILLTGHSRGACEAIAINNLFCNLLNADFDIEQIPQNLTQFITNPTRESLKFLNSDGATKIYPSNHQTYAKNYANTKITLILLDPVQGPDITGITHRAGFSLVEKFVPLLHADNHEICILTASDETRSWFDLHLPKQTISIPLEFSNILVSANHKDISLYNDSIRDTDYNDAHDIICHLLGFSLQTINGVWNNRDIKPRYKDNSIRKKLIFDSQLISSFKD